MRAVSLILALCFAAGCGTKGTGQTGSRSQYTGFQNYKFQLPSTAPTYPSYKAEDYRTVRDHSLTQSEVTLIRKTLALVKHCQRPLLRFAFPSNGGAEFPFVLFFQQQDYVWPHALWTYNMFYKPMEGEIFPGAGGDPEPDWHGIRYDVERIACDGRPIVPTH